VEIPVTVIAAVLMLVAIFGTIFPIIPGSPVAVFTVLAWAWILGSTAAWTTGIIAAATALVGMSASLILTGSTMRRQSIPRAPIHIAIVSSVIVVFINSFIGLFIGFAVGLLSAECYRRPDITAAERATLQAMNAMGFGIHIENGC